MYYFKKALITTLTLALIVLTACSDDPASSNGGERPEVPESTPAEVDNSYFEENSPPATEEFSGFNSAASHAQTANTSLATNTAAGEAYLMFTQFDDPEFQDGQWVWTFTIEEEGEVFTITTTAEEISGGTEWKVYLTGDLGEEVVNEFLFVTGFISNDGNSGNWTYYYPDEQGDSIPFLAYDWSIQSEDNLTLSFTIFGEDDNQDSSIEYTQDGPEHIILMQNYGFNESVEVYWNTSTGFGYVIEDGEQTCWDADFQNVSCPG